MGWRSHLVHCFPRFSTVLLKLKLTTKISKGPTDGNCNPLTDNSRNNLPFVFLPVLSSSFRSPSNHLYLKIASFSLIFQFVLNVMDNIQHKAQESLRIQFGFRKENENGNKIMALQPQFRKAWKHLGLVELTRQIQFTSSDKHPNYFFPSKFESTNFTYFLSHTGPSFIINFHPVLTQRYGETLGILLDNTPREFAGMLEKTQLQGSGSQNVLPGPTARTCETRRFSGHIPDLLNQKLGRVPSSVLTSPGVTLIYLKSLRTTK